MKRPFKTHASPPIMELMKILENIDDIFSPEDWAHYYETTHTRQASLRSLEIFIAEHAATHSTPIYKHAKWATLNNLMRRLFNVNSFRDLNIRNHRIDKDPTTISWDYQRNTIEAKKDPEQQSVNMTQLDRLFEHLDLHITMNVHDIVLVRDAD